LRSHKAGKEVIVPRIEKETNRVRVGFLGGGLSRGTKEKQYPSLFFAVYMGTKTFFAEIALFPLSFILAKIKYYAIKSM
jgi:hypothetical protein